MKEIFKVAIGLTLGGLAIIGIAYSIGQLTAHKDVDPAVEKFNQDYEHFCVLMDHYNNHEYSTVEDLVEDHSSFVEQFRQDSTFASLPTHVIRQVAAVILEGNEPLTPGTIIREYLENRKIYDVTSKLSPTGTPELQSDDTPPIEEYEALDVKTEDESPQNPKPVEQSSPQNNKTLKRI